MNSRRLYEYLKVAATFAGTIIGAGFASGQEITQFFVSYGRDGLWGIVIAACLFAWLGAVMLELGYRLKAAAYYDAIYHLFGNHFGRVLDWVTVMFLFSAFSIMLAGAATVTRDYFAVPYMTGLAGAGVVLIVTVLCGIRGIATANTIVTPLLIATVMAVSLYSLSYHEFNLDLFASRPVVNTPAPHWLLGSILYVSYNLIVSSTVLIPLGHSIRDKRVRLFGGILGGLVLGALAMIMAVVLMLHYPSICENEVPLLELASNQYPWSRFIYALTLLAAMYTTASASLYGCLTKARSLVSLRPLICSLAITVAAVAFGQIGFAKLIKLLFPAFGYVALGFTARLAWLGCRGR